VPEGIATSTTLPLIVPPLFAKVGGELAQAGGDGTGMAAAGRAQQHAAVPVEDLHRLALLGRRQRQGVGGLCLEAQPM
jgi:hypothetical protein